jgi:chorismate synthase
MIRFLDAGESHGKSLVAILEGMPAGLKIDEDFINNELTRRLKGYGRSERAKSIERDRVEILSGIRKGITLGSPIAIKIDNKDFKIDELPEVTRPRPGHADLAGALKYNRKNIRDILERASARETASRVAVGAVCKLFLKEFKVRMLSHIINLGGGKAHTKGLTFDQIQQAAAESSLRCADKAAEKLMIEEINKITESKDTLGGKFEVIVEGVPFGLGSHVHYDRKLDGRLAGALMSIQAVKAIEIGLGVEAAKKSGSQMHDQIYYDRKKGFYYKTNNAGGIEGGLTNGNPIIARCTMKPIPTLGLPLDSVDIESKKPFKAQIERSDITAVAACGVVAEAAVSFELAKAYLEKFGGDSLEESKANFSGYLEQLNRF